MARELVEISLFLCLIVFMALTVYKVRLGLGPGLGQLQGSAASQDATIRNAKL